MPLAYVIANELTNNGLLKFNPEKKNKIQNSYNYNIN